MKYKIPAVSNEFGAILKQSGRSRDSFLLQIADDWETIKKFSRKYNLQLRIVDVNTETRRKEPLYIFSDGLGGYNLKGLRDSL